MVRRYFLIRHRTCVCKQCSGLKRVYGEGWIRRIDENAADMHGVSGTIDRPLVELPYEELCPGSGALAELMAEYR